MESSRTCKNCGEHKSIEEFAKNGKYRRWTCNKCGIVKCLDRYYENHDEELKKRKALRASKKDWNRNERLKRLYGITSDQYDQMLIEQNHKCMTCGAAEHAQQHGKLAVDHCHETGKVRGLLCYKCNTSLGLLNDNVETLKTMVEYLNASRL